MAWYGEHDHELMDLKGAEVRIPEGAETPKEQLTRPNMNLVAFDFCAGVEVPFESYPFSEVTISKFEQEPPDYWRAVHQRVVSSRMKDLIEEFEPGRHRFKPLRVRMLDLPGQPYTKTKYYLVNLLEPLDALALNSSTGVRIDHSEVWGELRDVSSHPKFSLKLWMKAIIGRHVWLGSFQRIPFSHIYMSDQFYDEMSKRDLSGFVGKKCEVISDGNSKASS